MMKYLLDCLSLRTTAPIEILDITDQVKGLFAQARIRNGQLTICSRHTTAFVALNESETRLQQDMVDFLSGLIPCDSNYRHNLDPVDGRLNAHSHLLGLLMNTSETILISNGELLLGGWQSIFFVELDGPREQRELMVQIAGED